MTLILFRDALNQGCVFACPKGIFAGTSGKKWQKPVNNRYYRQRLAKSVFRILLENKLRNQYNIILTLQVKLFLSFSWTFVGHLLTFLPQSMTISLLLITH